jgi:putative chitobiose transport system permease protein
MAPALIVLLMFSLVAIWQVGYYSLTRFTAFVGPEWVGLANYRAVFASTRFWMCLGNSFLYLLVTPAIIVLSISAAMIVEADLRGMRWLRLALFLPVVTPAIVAALAWRLLLNEDSGLLNQGLRAVGASDIPWLSQHPWTLVSAATVTLWKGFGFYMLVFLAALLAVPRELREAASLDGAGRWRTFRVVVLPTLWPSIVLVFVVSSISALKVFDELFATVRGAPITSQTAVPLIYQTAFEDGNYGLASAMGVVLFAVILVFSIANVMISTRRKARTEGRVG